MKDLYISAALAAESAIVDSVSETASVVSIICSAIVAFVTVAYKVTPTIIEIYRKWRDKDKDDKSE